MIDGLERALDAWTGAGARDLLAGLLPVLGGTCARGRLLAAEALPRDRVLRVRLEVGGAPRSLFVKRFPPERAHRERIATLRWLPRVGLGAKGPPLLATVAERSGGCTWFVYEDLGDCTLAAHASDPERVHAAVALLAELHARFTAHALLAEARQLGADLGSGFYAASIRDARRGLLAVLAQVPLAADARATCEGLLDRLARMGLEQGERTAALGRWGGPETLLHGDPWTINILVRPTPDGLDARLIDWDHAGVGFVSYDLSTFLLRFPPEARSGILADYQACRGSGPVGPRRWPAPAEWNALFDTAERARIANAIGWRALAALDGHVEWAHSELAELEQALATLGPVLPTDARAPLAAAGAGGRA